MTRGEKYSSGAARTTHHIINSRTTSSSCSNSRTERGMRRQRSEDGDLEEEADSGGGGGGVVREGGGGTCSGGSRLWIFLVVGALVEVLGLAVGGIYLNIRSITSSLQHTEILPTYVPVAAVLLTGMLVLLLFWKRLHLLVFLTSVVSVGVGLLCAGTAILMGTHIIRPMMHFTRCYMSRDQCHCLSPYNRQQLSLNYSEKALTTYVYAGAKQCSLVQTDLVNMLFALCGVYAIIFIVCIVVAVLSLLAYRTERMYKLSLESDSYEEIFTVSNCSSTQDQDNDIHHHTPNRHHNQPRETHHLLRSTTPSHYRRATTTTTTTAAPAITTSGGYAATTGVTDFIYSPSDIPMDYNEACRMRQRSHSFSQLPTSGRRRQNQSFDSTESAQGGLLYASSTLGRAEGGGGAGGGQGRRQGQGQGRLKENRRRARRAVTLANLDHQQLMLIMSLQLRYLQESGSDRQFQVNTQKLELQTRRSVTPPTTRGASGSNSHAVSAAGVGARAYPENTLTNAGGGTCYSDVDTRPVKLVRSHTPQPRPTHLLHNEAPPPANFHPVQPHPQMHAAHTRTSRAHSHFVPAHSLSSSPFVSASDYENGFVTASSPVSPPFVDYENVAGYSEPTSPTATARSVSTGHASFAGPRNSSGTEVANLANNSPQTTQPGSLRATALVEPVRAAGVGTAGDGGGGLGGGCGSSSVVPTSARAGEGGDGGEEEVGENGYMIMQGGMSKTSSSTTYSPYSATRQERPEGEAAAERGVQRLAASAATSERRANGMMTLPAGGGGREAVVTSTSPQPAARANSYENVDNMSACGVPSAAHRDPLYENQKESLASKRLRRRASNPRHHHQNQSDVADGNSAGVGGGAIVAVQGHLVEGKGEGRDGEHPGRPKSYINAVEGVEDTSSSPSSSPSSSTPSDDSEMDDRHHQPRPRPNSRRAPSHRQSAKHHHHHHHSHHHSSPQTYSPQHQQQHHLSQPVLNSSPSLQHHHTNPVLGHPAGLVSSSSAVAGEAGPGKKGAGTADLRLHPQEDDSLGGVIDIYAQPRKKGRPLPPRPVGAAVVSDMSRAGGMVMARNGSAQSLPGGESVARQHNNSTLSLTASDGGGGGSGRNSSLSLLSSGGVDGVVGSPRLSAFHKVSRPPPPPYSGSQAHHGGGGGHASCDTDLDELEPLPYPGRGSRKSSSSSAAFKPGIGAPPYSSPPSYECLVSSRHGSVHSLASSSSHTTTADERDPELYRQIRKKRNPSPGGGASTAGGGAGGVVTKSPGSHSGSFQHLNSSHRGSPVSGGVISLDNNGYVPLQRSSVPPEPFGDNNNMNNSSSSVKGSSLKRLNSPGNNHHNFVGGGSSSGRGSGGGFVSFTNGKLGQGQGQGRSYMSGWEGSWDHHQQQHHPGNGTNSYPFRKHHPHLPHPANSSSATESLSLYQHPLQQQTSGTSANVARSYENLDDDDVFVDSASSGSVAFPTGPQRHQFDINSNRMMGRADVDFDQFPNGQNVDSDSEFMETVI